MDWVHIFSAVITTVATVVLAAFNIKYVRLVRKMLIAAHRPEIIVHYKWDKPVDYKWDKSMEPGLGGIDFIVYLYVKNVGRGTAYNIEFIYDKSYKLPIFMEEISDRSLDEIKFLRDGISILEQGGERTDIAFGGKSEVIFNILKQFWEKEEKHTTDITVIYEDSEKVSYQQTLTIDFCRPNYSNE
ncbi:hypothetical protein C6499_08365 [Candidatus Poribacteria bacterium]|nr:MAG: hypothetical protein C6499_08365 [Candidatus Poribacteria bacterium]